MRPKPIASSSDSSSSDNEPERGGRCGRRSKYIACCGVVSILALVAGTHFLLIKTLTDIALGPAFLAIDEDAVNFACGPTDTMSNILDSAGSWWPGCEYHNFSLSPAAGGGFCGSPCFDRDFMHHMMAFSMEMPQQLIFYHPRQHNGTASNLTLGGWWLPADAPPLLGGAAAPPARPRIVVQHGFTSNSNKYRTFTIAYMLRSMGFDVLLSNFRDHCYSDDTGLGFNTWGHAYPYDLLGAWDYARHDPDGVLGGPREASQVGILGFSMGAFTAVNAFGLDPDVPAVWVDGPPFSPEGAFAHSAKLELQDMGLGLFADYLISAVWANVMEFASSRGVDLTETTPAKVLPAGPDTHRKIFWAGNFGDTLVPISEGQKLVSVLQEYPNKYEIFGTLEASGSCHGGSHCNDHLRMPKEYGRLLCKFWGAVFGKSEASCGLDGLNWTNPPGFIDNEVEFGPNSPIVTRRLEVGVLV